MPKLTKDKTSAGRTQEKKAAYDLILAFHERRDVEDVVGLNSKLAEVIETSPSEIDIMTGALRLSIDFAHGGNNVPFRKKWFVELDQRVVSKNAEYECSWVYVAACILSVVADPEISQTVPRNIATYHAAMIIEDLIDVSLADGERFEDLLARILDWTEDFLDS